MASITSLAPYLTEWRFAVVLVVCVGERRSFCSAYRRLKMLSSLTKSSASRCSDILRSPRADAERLPVARAGIEILLSMGRLGALFGWDLKSIFLLTALEQWVSNVGLGSCPRMMDEGITDERRLLQQRHISWMSLGRVQECNAPREASR